MPVKEAPHRVAVAEQDRRTGALVDVMHPTGRGLEPPGLEWIKHWIWSEIDVHCYFSGLSRVRRRPAGHASGAHCRREDLVAPSRYWANAPHRHTACTIDGQLGQKAMAHRMAAFIITGPDATLRRLLKQATTRRSYETRSDRPQISTNETPPLAGCSRSRAASPLS